MSGLSTRDRVRLREHGLPIDEAERQLSLLRAPPPHIRLLRPCTLGDGIRQLDAMATDRLEASWARAAGAGRLAKLVPASGAATRMFQRLLSEQALASEPGERPAVSALRAQLERFAFFPLLAAAAGGEDPLRALDDGGLLDLLLGPAGLGLAAKPKALIPFHHDPAAATGSRTALEEHLLESIGYLAGPDRRSRLHITIGSEHHNAIRSYLSSDPNGLLRDRPDIFEVQLSNQSPASDTLALDSEGRPFRRSDDSLLLRPGGHGALLDNLAVMGGDVVVIKNIDNVVPASRHTKIGATLRDLIGHLLMIEGQIHQAVARLDDSGERERALDDALRLLGDSLGLVEARDLLRRDAATKEAFVRDRLERPLRVCGVVLNRGEPGGGPFWVREEAGGVSPQIVESAQVDQRDGEQRAIFARATHFNPVLLVCSLRDRRGRLFDLKRFANPRRALITEKTDRGRPLRAFEHPGLWNGGMAYWNTLFVEVPQTVFAPVKTVFDLLRPEHQPS